MCIARSGGAGERRRRPACTIDWSWHILPPRPPPPFHGKVVHRGRPSLAFCCSSISAIIGFLAPLSPPWTGSLSIAYETNIDLSTCILDSSIDETKRGGKTRGKIKSRREREERKDAHLGRNLLFAAQNRERNRGSHSQTFKIQPRYGREGRVRPFTRYKYMRRWNVDAPKSRKAPILEQIGYARRRRIDCRSTRHGVTGFVDDDRLCSPAFATIRIAYDRISPGPPGRRCQASAGPSFLLFRDLSTANRKHSVSQVISVDAI